MAAFSAGKWNAQKETQKEYRIELGYDYHQCLSPIQLLDIHIVHKNIKKRHLQDVLSDILSFSSFIWTFGKAFFSFLGSILKCLL